MKFFALAVLGTSVVGSRASDAQTLSVSGNPGLLRISTAIAGSEPVAVTDGATTYSVSTGNPNRIYKISARLSAPMPVGVTLTASLAAPPAATSLGPVALDGIARDVVTGIPRRTTATQAITYTFSATVAAGVIPNSSRTVTLTLVEQP